MPLVFSQNEVEHIHNLPEPAKGFCASFCCKEAFFKAIAHPIDYRTCQLFYNPAHQEQQIILSSIKELPLLLKECRTFVKQPSDDELIALIYLFGGK
jgi:phosphopantetheinyl transferase (holo-ACP synthase)